MKIEIEEHKGIPIAHINSDEVILSNAQDAVDLLMNCRYQGADEIIVLQAHLATGFFDLKTGIAGEILQKFSTYGARLAIVGDFQIPSSNSLRDFISESNRAGRISFVGSLEEAITALCKS